MGPKWISILEPKKDFKKAYRRIFNWVTWHSGSTHVTRERTPTVTRHQLYSHPQCSIQLTQLPGVSFASHVSGLSLNRVTIAISITKALGTLIAPAQFFSLPLLKHRYVGQKNQTLLLSTTLGLLFCQVFLSKRK